MKKIHELKNLPFARSFDTRQYEASEVESMKAAAKLRTLASDTLLHHIEDVQSFEIIKEKRENCVGLIYEVNEDTFLSIHVSQYGDGLSQISVQEVTDGYGKVAHRYYQDEAGDLRRYDYDPSSDESKATEKMAQNAKNEAMQYIRLSTSVESAIIGNTPALNPEEKNSILQALENQVAIHETDHDIAEFHKAIKTDKLEQQTGANRQRVDCEEVANLQIIIGHSIVNKRDR